MVFQTEFTLMFTPHVTPRTNIHTCPICNTNPSEFCINTLMLTVGITEYNNTLELLPYPFRAKHQILRSVWNQLMTESGSWRYMAMCTSKSADYGGFGRQAQQWTLWWSKLGRNMRNLSDTSQSKPVKGGRIGMSTLSDIIIGPCKSIWWQHLSMCALHRLVCHQYMLCGSHARTISPCAHPTLV